MLIITSSVFTSINHNNDFCQIPVSAFLHGAAIEHLADEDEAKEVKYYLLMAVLTAIFVTRGTCAFVSNETLPVQPYHGRSILWMMINDEQ